MNALSPVFGGAKVALLAGQKLLVYLRDEKPEIPWPGQWDLPGGGREADESWQDCLIREVMEEFAIKLDRPTFTWSREYASSLPDGLPTIFAVGQISEAQIKAVDFGSEGQRWTLMDIFEFLEHPLAIGHLTHRLTDYLNEAG